MMRYALLHRPMCRDARRDGDRRPDPGLRRRSLGHACAVLAGGGHAPGPATGDPDRAGAAAPRRVRHAAPGAHPRGLDDLPVGRRAGCAPGGLDARRGAPGVAARCRRGRPPDPGRRGHGDVHRPPRRAHPAARAGLRRHDTLRRRERPDPGLRLRVRNGDGRPHRGRRPARREDRRARRGLRARAQERRRRARPCALLLDRLQRQHLRRRPGRHAATRHDHARPAGRRRPAGLHPRGAERHRPRGRPRRLGVDRRERPRQHRVPVRRPVRRRVGLLSATWSTTTSPITRPRRWPS